MLNFVVEKWYKYKKDLENYFQSHKQSDYAEEYYDFLKITLLTIFPEVDNCDNNITKHTFCVDDIQAIDFCNYSGTLIFVFHLPVYDPDLTETFYTTVDYGSCTGCDTLMRISNKELKERPTMAQTQAYMQLALNLVQNIKPFKGEDYE